MDTNDNLTVYVVHYTHKHGCDISVYGTLEKAQESARDLMSNRAAESWDQYALNRVECCETFDQLMSLFHDIESNVSYGETIEIMHRVVG